MSQELLRSLVWMDYRLAILFAVIFPLVLLLWVTFQRMEAMQRLLIIYWRVSSLLAITIYLMIGGLPLSFMSAVMARILIPIGLWFWVDVNEEIDDHPRTLLKTVFTSWRWAMSIYSVLGALLSLPFLQCALSTTTFGTPFCQVWLEAPLLYKDRIHPGYTPQFLAFLGILGLVVYVIYLGYFVLVRLSKQGRTAMET